jgi:hypothetical protein
MYFKEQELLTPGFLQYTTLTLNFMNYCQGGQIEEFREINLR